MISGSEMISSEVVAGEVGILKEQFDKYSYLLSFQEFPIVPHLSIQYKAPNS